MSALMLWSAVGPLAVIFAVLAQVLPPDDIPTSDLWKLVAPIVIAVALTVLRNMPPTTPDLAKRAIVAGVSCAVAAVGLYAEGRLDLANWFRTALFIVFAAAGFYALLWKPFQDSVLFGIKETAINAKGVVVDTGH